MNLGTGHRLGLVLRVSLSEGSVVLGCCLGGGSLISGGLLHLLNLVLGLLNLLGGLLGFLLGSLDGLFGSLVGNSLLFIEDISLEEAR